MTTDMMNTRNLVEQASDGLRERNRFAAERLMEVKVGAVTGAAGAEERLPRPGLENARRGGRAAHLELVEGHRGSSNRAGWRRSLWRPMLMAFRPISVGSVPPIWNPNGTPKSLPLPLAATCA